MADKIASLGGQPIIEPRAVPPAEHPRQMVEQALAAEKQAIADYDKRLRQADAFGDVGLKVSLENHVADETNAFAPAGMTAEYLQAVRRRLQLMGDRSTALLFDDPRSSVTKGKEPDEVQQEFRRRCL